MQRRSITWLLVLGLVVLAGGWLAGSGFSEKPRKPAAKAKPARQFLPADQPPVTAGLPDGITVLRVRLGSKPIPGQPKREPTVWDGQLTVSGGRLHQLRLWQDDPRDTVEGHRWKIATRHNTPWSSEERKKGHAALPVADAALVVELAGAGPDTEVALETAQGDFRFTLRDVAWGAAKSFLSNLVEVWRVAHSGTILSAPGEDDFPSAAIAPDGTLYIAYVAFKHGKDFRQRMIIEEPLQQFDKLAEPTGGDQVLLLEGDGRRWTGPTPVTSPGGDVFRTATAVDGSGRVWVFWSANSKSGWGLFGRCREGGAWSETLRLGEGRGPDVFPAAATDASGRVWVAWQAFQGDNSNILAARQEGKRLGKPMVVSAGKANEWTPAIAVSANGHVAVAWDTYAKGDYDVYARVWSDGQWGQPIAVATSAEAQMRPSLAYDAAGRLWIAYESSPENWGKDWGALERSGTPLYRGRSVAVRIWSEGKLWTTAEEPLEAFLMWRAKPGAKAKPKPAAKLAPAGQRGLQLALPRLVADSSGRVWLAVRSGALGGRAPTGSWWYEHLAWYEGKRWSGQVICPGTDNTLDNRPALVARPSGEIVLVAASDGRSKTASELPRWFIKEQLAKGVTLYQREAQSPWPDAVNNELVMAVAGPVGGSPQAPQLREVALPQAGKPSASAAAEAAMIARLRQARTALGGKTLRLMRGEFHRHTELSQDGAGDGMLMDMWRYAFDTAGLDWVGNGDHDNGDGREYSWWITQKTTDLFGLSGAFAPMYTYERSVNYPDGHRNAVFAQRGVRTLPRLRGGLGQAMDQLPADAPRPHSPDTQMLYRYLEQFGGVCASHTSGTDMGTDWRDNSSKVEPVVEISQRCRQNYEMPGAPRSNSQRDSIGGWRPLGFVSLALKKGYRLGFQSSSDHGSTHISFCNCWVEEPTREGILAAMKARHVYGATDHILAEVRCGEQFMGDEFTSPAKPRLEIRLWGLKPFAKVHVIKDGNYVHTAEPNTADVELQWTDMAPTPGKTSYYYVRGEQVDGEMVWASPMWIKYSGQ